MVKGMPLQLKVFVNQPSGDDFVALFLERAPKSFPYIMVKDQKDADIVVFTGGSDVQPILYGEAPLIVTHFNPARDQADIKSFRMAQKMGQFKIGICRGGQFLNVMNGGKLWQDVDMHCRTHILTDAFTGKKWAVSSTHHQMFRPAAGALIVATARESTQKVCDGQTWEIKNDGSNMDNYFKTDFEVLFYPETRTLCFQPHPEYDIPITTAFYFHDVLARCFHFEDTHEDHLTQRKEA